MDPKHNQTMESETVLWEEGVMSEFLARHQEHESLNLSYNPVFTENYGKYPDSQSLFWNDQQYREHKADPFLYEPADPSYLAEAEKNNFSYNQDLYHSLYQQQAILLPEQETSYHLTF